MAAIRDANVTRLRLSQRAHAPSRNAAGAWGTTTIGAGRDTRAGKPIEGVEHEVGRVRYSPKAPFLIPLESTDSFRGIIAPLHIRRIENVAQLVTGKAEFESVKCIKLGAKQRATAISPR